MREQTRWNGAMRLQALCLTAVLACLLGAASAGAQALLKVEDVLGPVNGNTAPAVEMQWWSGTQTRANSTPITVVLWPAAPIGAINGYLPPVETLCSPVILPVGSLVRNFIDGNATTRSCSGVLPPGADDFIFIGAPPVLTTIPRTQFAWQVRPVRTEVVKWPAALTGPSAESDLPDIGTPCSNSGLPYGALTRGQVITGTATARSCP